MSAEVSRTRVEAPARLHLGFLDPAASSGRQFGSIGLALDTLATVVRVEPAGTLSFAAPGDERVQALLDTLIEHYALPRALAVHLDAAIPAHAGLGSGTQLALALGVAVLRACGREADTAELGALLGRGRRSGIGLNLFTHGGLVVDAGRGPTTRTPPMVSRLPFPEAWRVLLVFDEAHCGLSGAAEIDAFRALPPLPAASAAELCRLTLLGVLPALVEVDFTTFSRAISALQRVIGDYFAAVQSGPYTSARVHEVMRCLDLEHGIEGVGQSSWGPTAFAFIDSAARAADLRAMLEARHAGIPGLRFLVCRGRNHGARIDCQVSAANRRVAAG